MTVAALFQSFYNLSLNLLPYHPKQEHSRNDMAQLVPDKLHMLYLG